MYIAVEGCCHGALDKIYETMQNLERRDNIKIDILLCCGDFQAVRDEADLSSMAVPDKYKSMETFWQYYNGTKKAPCLTIFIGGNHEASNHLQELPYGGWVAPNIYYMGYASVITYKGVRIGGISGIFKYHDFNKGHYEKPPYDEGSKRSVYHVRSSEVFRLMLLKNPVDIMMSHDWPCGIVHYGNIPQLLRRKPFFEEDIQRNRLGSPPLMDLLHHMKPKYWFSGHLHVKFSATVCHDPTPPQSGRNPKLTHFLALDKCLPRREFLQVIKVDGPAGCEDKGLCFDAEWFSVLQATNDLLSVSRRFVNLPKISDINIFPQYNVTPQNIEAVKKLFDDDMTIPENFKCDISPLYNPQKHNRNKLVVCKTNHQTTELCNKLQITDPLMMAVSAEGGDMSLSFNSSSFLEEDDIPSTIVSTTSINEDEINLDSDDDEEKATVGYESELKNGDDASKAEVFPDEKSPLSYHKNMSTSVANKNLMRMSLDLPSPKYGTTSTPIRDNVSANVKSDLPIPVDFGNSPIRSLTSSLGKNALLASLREKRLSDPESDKTPDSSSVNPAKVPRTFKRRNASLYTSQGDNETP